MTDSKRSISSGTIVLIGGALGLVGAVGEFASSGEISWTGLLIAGFALVVWQTHRRRKNVDRA